MLRLSFTGMLCDRIMFKRPSPRRQSKAFWESMKWITRRISIQMPTLSYSTIWKSALWYFYLPRIQPAIVLASHLYLPSSFLWQSYQAPSLAFFGINIHIIKPFNHCSWITFLPQNPWCCHAPCALKYPDPPSRAWPPCYPHCPFYCLDKRELLAWLPPNWWVQCWYSWFPTLGGSQSWWGSLTGESLFSTSSKRSFHCALLLGSSSIALRTTYLFHSSTAKALLMGWFYSLLNWGNGCFILFSMSFMVVHKRWWSEVTYANCITLVSQPDFLKCLCMNIWSMQLWYLLLGRVHVAWYQWYQW